MALASETCRFLDLPPELRIIIYDLTFAVSSPPETPVEKLSDLHPPSPALIQTCRQIYIEAALIFKKSDDVFWKTTPFVIGRKKSSRELIDSIRADRVGRITDITIDLTETRPTGPPPLMLTLHGDEWHGKRTSGRLCSISFGPGPRLHPKHAPLGRNHVRGVCDDMPSILGVLSRITEGVGAASWKADKVCLGRVCLTKQELHAMIRFVYFRGFW